MNLILPIYSIMLLSLLIIVYFSKKRVKSQETKLYSVLLIISFFNIIFNIIGIYLGYNNGSLFFLEILNHFDLPLYFWWVSILFSYLLYVYMPNSKKYYYTEAIILSLNVLITLVSFILPVEVVITKSAGFAIGLCVNMVYSICGFYLLSSLIVALLLIKKNNFKKTIPIFSLLILGIISVFIQKNIPSLIIIPAVIVFVELIMYFTIENPDVKLLKEVNMAKSLADKSNQAKSDFISSMSHEIRTPLNTIVGLSSLLLEDNKELKSLKEDLNNILEASKNLEEIVGSILDISTIEANALKINKNVYNIENVLKETIDLVKFKANEKKLNIKLEIGEISSVDLIGDSLNIKKILTNLLTNAIKYTDKGYVKINVDGIIKNNICKLIIKVEDTGKGIKEKDLDKLFNKFERLDTEKNSTIVGTGLGLAIVKEIIELMKGKIKVESVYGEGTSFTVYLDQKISNSVNCNNKKNDEVQEIKENNDFIDFSNKNVLIVDDNKLNIKVASRLLEKYKINIESSESGYDCIDKIKSGKKYDLIFMDIMMPEMGGVETLSKLKEIKNFKTPVISLTADATEKAEEEYLFYGFAEYMAKPINKDKLNDILIKYLVK